MLKSLVRLSLRSIVSVSVLYREPKLLKSGKSAANRIEPPDVSVLYREPKLLKSPSVPFVSEYREDVSVLYREPKLLKCNGRIRDITS